MLPGLGLVPSRRVQWQTVRPQAEVQHQPAKDEHDEAPPQIDSDVLRSPVKIDVRARRDAVNREYRTEEEEQRSDRNANVESSFAAHVSPRLEEDQVERQRRGQNNYREHCRLLVPGLDSLRWLRSQTVNQANELALFARTSGEAHDDRHYEARHPRGDRGPE